MTRTAAPAALKVKVPKLDTADLLSAYEWMPVDKAIGFKLAFDWYGETIAPKEGVSPLLFKDPLDADRQKTYSKAVKSRSLGDQGTTPYEQEAGWTMALRLFEKVWATKSLPSIEIALKETTVSRGVSDLQKVLSTLNSAFLAFGFEFRITLSSDRDMDLEKRIVFLPITELRGMVGQSPLKTILKEVMTVAQAASIVSLSRLDANGSPVSENGKPVIDHQLDGNRFMTNLPLVLDSVGSWAGAGSNLTSPIGKVVTTQPRAPKAQGTGVPRAPRASTTIVCVDPWGLFRANTIKAAIASLLFDRTWHPMADLKDICRQNGASEGPVHHTLRELGTKGTVEFRNGRREVRVS